MSGLRLIVNADDFGISEAVNRGIVEAHDRGIVTSTSIMATGSAFEHALELARLRPSLGVGVHLVLTEQRPLTGAAAAPSARDARLWQGLGAAARARWRARDRKSVV